MQSKHGIEGQVNNMGKVYDRFIDDYIDENEMDINAPPERYAVITPDMLVANAARWLCEVIKSDLKPCPFCGDLFIYTHRKNGKYTIGCNSLNCVCLHTEGKLFNSEEDAIEAWNKRIRQDD